VKFFNNMFRLSSDKKSLLVAVNYLDIITLINTLVKFNKFNITFATHGVGFFAEIAFKLIRQTTLIRVQEYSYMTYDDKPIDISPFTSEKVSRLAYDLSDKVISHYKKDEKSEYNLLKVLESYAYYCINSKIHKILTWNFMSKNLDKFDDVYIYSDKEVWSKYFEEALSQSLTFNAKFLYKNKSFLEVFDRRLKTSSKLIYKVIFSKYDNSKTIPVQIKLPDRLKSRSIMSDIPFSKITNKSTSIGISIAGNFLSFLRNDTSGLKLPSRNYKLFYSGEEGLQKLNKSHENYDSIVSTNKLPNLFLLPIYLIKTRMYAEQVYSTLCRESKTNSELSQLALADYKKHCKKMVGVYYYHYIKNNTKLLLLSDYMEPMFAKLFAVTATKGVSVYYDRSVGYCFPDFTYIVPSMYRCYSNEYEYNLPPFKYEFQIPLSIPIPFRGKESLVTKYFKSFIDEMNHKGPVVLFMDESLDSKIYNNFIEGITLAVKKLPDVMFIFKPKKIDKLNSMDKLVKLDFNNLVADSRILIAEPSIRVSDLIHISDVVITLPSTTYFETVKLDKRVLAYDYYGVMSSYFSSKSYSVSNIYSSMDTLVGDLVGNFDNLKLVKDNAIHKPIPNSFSMQSLEDLLTKYS